MVGPLDQWDCVLEWSCRVSSGLPPTPSNLTRALNSQCVARRRRTCKEWNGTREGMWCVIMMAFHIVNLKASEEPTEGQRSRQLFKSLARILVKRPLKGNEASDRITFRHQCSETSLTENPVPLWVWVHPWDVDAAPLGEKQTVDPLDQWVCVLEWSCRASTSH
jgi:hypothetical protein